MPSLRGWIGFLLRVSLLVLLRRFTSVSRVLTLVMWSRLPFRVMVQLVRRSRCRTVVVRRMLLLLVATLRLRTMRLLRRWIMFAVLMILILIPLAVFVMRLLTFVRCAMRATIVASIMTIRLIGAIPRRSK